MQCLQIFFMRQAVHCVEVDLWCFESLRRYDLISGSGLAQTSMAGAVKTLLVWLVQCEGDWTGAFCALKQTLHIAGDVYGLCGAYKWVSVWFKDGSALHAPSNWACVWKLLCYFPLTDSATCTSSPCCGFLKQCLELALCVKVVQYVFCVLQLSVNVIEGEGQVIFRYSLQQH